MEIFVAFCVGLFLGCILGHFDAAYQAKSKRAEVMKYPNNSILSCPAYLTMSWKSMKRTINPARGISRSTKLQLSVAQKNDATPQNNHPMARKVGWQAIRILPLVNISRKSQAPRVIMARGQM